MKSQLAEQSTRALVEAFVQEGMSDPVFCKGLIRARTSGLDLKRTLQLLVALTSPPPSIRWSLLGHPDAGVCKAISDHLGQVAAAIRLQQNDLDVTLSAAVPGYQGRADLLVYAVLQSAAPIDLAGLMSILGPDEVADRLTRFASIVDAACTVG